MKKLSSKDLAGIIGKPKEHPEEDEKRKKERLKMMKDLKELNKRNNIETKEYIKEYPFVGEFADKLNISYQTKARVKDMLRYLKIKNENDMLILNEREILCSPGVGIKAYEEIQRVWIHEYKHSIFHKCNGEGIHLDTFIDAIEFRL